jgi:hypothetical protein
MQIIKILYFYQEMYLFSFFFLRNKPNLFDLKVIKEFGILINKIYFETFKNSSLFKFS